MRKLIAELIESPIQRAISHQPGSYRSCKGVEVSYQDLARPDLGDAQVSESAPTIGADAGADVKPDDGSEPFVRRSSPSHISLVLMVLFRRCW